MRTLMIASAALALMTASGADAGQMTPAAGAPGGHMGSMMHGRGMMNGGGMMPGVPGGWHRTPGMPGGHMGGSRWGSKVGGHWWGGMNAPGGWNAYRRPTRGYALPGYWINPRFYINDWSGYGLTQPSYGYNWVRYYDDAVLVDSRGSVFDVYDGIDWDGYGNAYDVDDRYAGGDDRYAGGDRGGYAQGGYYANRGAAGGGYVPVAPRYDDRSDGVAGAVVGGVVGGVAGNLIAGRGNRLGGTLIGAGVGAAAGYAIDRASSTGPRRVAPGVGYGAPYAAPYPGGGYPDQGYASRGYVGGDRGTTITSNGGTTVTTTATGGYAAGGYYFPAGSTTTVVVQQAPVVTTTTTEVYDDRVTYARPRAHRTKIVRRWRAPATCSCR